MRIFEPSKACLFRNLKLFAANHLFLRNYSNYELARNMSAKTQ